MKRHGFTLVEVLFVVALLGVFTLLASQLFLSTIRVFRGAEVAQEDAVRYESLSRRLARDAWGATRIETPDTNSATLTRTDGTRITWTRSPEDGALVRSTLTPDGGAQQSIASRLAEPIGFAAEGGSLVVRPLRSGALIVTERRFPSQILLGQGARP